ncbi:hypothetical protein BpHYR1_048550 [Brachionus plicatilis]|uniref:Uncharacterized protein n=1 Tax=Brachionus plicatilis TaxID=10195 RepID=A0A3M7SJK9_BRAPC|nr:hypothetical protein BpHYR1_048550 [Brachionus plicatilis]
MILLTASLLSITSQINRCNGTFRYYNNLLTHKKCHSKTLQNDSPVEDQSKSANPELDITLTEADSFTPCLSQYVDPAYEESSELIGFVNDDKLDNQEHVININSDDEEYTTCAVVLENLFGSARTDYKSNHAYIEKYIRKRKNSKENHCSVKRVKSVDCEEVDLMGNGQSPSLSGSFTNSSLDSIKSTLKQTLTSKQLRNRPLSSSLSFDIDYTSELKDSISLPDSSDSFQSRVSD